MCILYLRLLSFVQSATEVRGFRCVFLQTGPQASGSTSSQVLFSRTPQPQLIKQIRAVPVYSIGSLLPSESLSHLIQSYLQRGVCRNVEIELFEAGHRLSPESSMCKAGQRNWASHHLEQSTLSCELLQRLQQTPSKSPHAEP